MVVQALSRCQTNDKVGQVLLPNFIGRENRPTLSANFLNARVVCRPTNKNMADDSTDEDAAAATLVLLYIVFVERRNAAEIELSALSRGY